MSKNKTIIYILSNQRSGSTLLENVLSKSSEIISVGELHHLDSHIHKGEWGGKWNWKCSCGQSFEDCEFWLEVYEKMGIKDPKEINRTTIPRVDNDKENNRTENEKTVTLLNRIYEAVFLVSGNSIVVDSSKEPRQCSYLYENSPFNFKIIHLKRDLRAVTLSINKWNTKRNRKNVSLVKLLVGGFLYKMKCISILKKANKSDVLQFSYKDFMKAPQEHLDQIADFADFEKFEFPEYTELQDDHTVGGTPNRFEKRKINFDDKWKSRAKKNPIFNFLGYVLNKIG